MLEFDLCLFLVPSMISLHVALYHFWFKNWNPDPGKPTFRHAWRHIGVWPPHLYLVSFQDQPPATSRWPDTISDIRIEIFALTKLHLDIHEVILEFDIYICIWSGSRWPHIIFYIESLTITNLHLDIHEGILDCDLYLYLAGLQDQPPTPSSFLSGLQMPRFNI